MRNRRNAKLVALILILLIITAVCVRLITHKSQPLQPVSSSSHQIVNLSTVLTNIKTTISQQLPSLQITTAPDQVNTIGYPVAGYSFAVIIPSSAQTELSFSGNTTTETSNDLYQKVETLIKSQLQRAYFEELPASNENIAGLITVYYFQRSDAVCQLTEYTTLDLSCATKNTMENIANDAAPLVAAYTATNPTTDMTAIATPTITASQTPGYTIASLPIFGSNGETVLKLYKEEGGTWQVVNLNWYIDPHENDNIEPICEDFDSLAATLNAFKGQPCFDTYVRKQTTIE